MILLATIGGLITLVFWGASDYFLGKGGKESDEYLTVFISEVPGVLVALPFVLWYGLGAGLDTTLAIIFIISVLFFIGTVLYIKALNIGPFGVAAPIGNLYPLVTLLLGVAFFGIVFSAIQFAALLAIIAGIVLLGLE